MTFFVILAMNWALNAQASTIADRWLTLVNYPSRDDLLADLKKYSPNLEVAPTDPVVDAQVKELITQLDRQYRMLFPALMKNKAFPDFIVVNAESVTSEFSYQSRTIPGTSTYHGFVAIPNGPLKDPTQRAAIAGILSHELAHLFLNHHDINSSILRMWRTTSPNIPLDPASTQAVKSYLTDAAVAGGFIDENLDGIPLDDSYLLTVFQDKAEKFKAQFAGAPCLQSIIDEADTTMAFMGQDFSYFDWSIQFPSPQQAAQVKSGLLGFENHLIKCSRQLDFADETLKWWHFPLNGQVVRSEDYLSNLFGVPFSWDRQNEFEVLFAATRALHSRMRQTWANNHLEAVRWRSFEDEADEFAIAIMKAEAFSPTDFAKSLFSIFERREPGFTARCETAIANHTAVPFGNFGDPHHGLCYRYQSIVLHATDSGFKAMP